MSHYLPLVGAEAGKGVGEDLPGVHDVPDDESWPHKEIPQFVAWGTPIDVPFQAFLDVLSDVRLCTMQKSLLVQNTNWPTRNLYAIDCNTSHNTLPQLKSYSKVASLFLMKFLQQLEMYKINLGKQITLSKFNFEQLLQTNIPDEIQWQHFPLLSVRDKIIRKKRFSIQ